MSGQVRWQNERYTMPAVAWLFTSAALGLGLLLGYFVRRPVKPPAQAVCLIATVAMVAGAWLLAFRP